MDAQDYQNSITIQASPEEAFDKISRVSEWWALDTKGNSRNLGDEFTVRFGDTFVHFKITEVVPDKKIVWSVVDCNLSWLEDTKEWNGTEVVWHITRHDDETTITMTHVGLTPRIACYNDCQGGWNEYIEQSLFEFLTKNKGRPDEF